MSDESMFDGIEDEKSSEGGRYFPEGIHAVMISSVKRRKGFKGKSFIVEATLLASTNPQAAVGSDYTWLQKMEKEGALSRVKTFAMRATNSEENEITSAVMEQLAGNEQPLVGLLISVEGYPTQTKKGDNITAVKWVTLEGEKLKGAYATAKRLGVFKQPCALQAEILKKIAA